jgi:hypothetical protein
MMIGRILAGAGLLVLPFIISTSGDEGFREPKARALAVIFGLWIASELWKKVHPSLGCAAGALFLYAGLTPLVPNDLGVLALLAALGSCLLVAKSSKDDIKRGLEVLEISGLLCTALAAIQFAGIENGFVNIIPSGTPSAAFGQQTLYGPFAVACFASALFHGRHIRALLLLLPILVVASSLTFLSFGVVLFLFLVRKMGRKALLVAFAGLLLIPVANMAWPKTMYELTDDKGRFFLWGQTVKIANRHWALGHGFSSFRYIYPIFQDARLRAANGIEDEKQSPEMRRFFYEADLLRQRSGIFLHPHNEPLLVYFQFGALGLILGLWWILAFFWAWARLPNEPWNWALAAIFFSSLANSLGNFNFHLIPQVLLPLWAFVAVTSRRKGAILEADAYYSR